MGMSKFLGKRKYLAINLFLFAILYFSVSFNKEYIRPSFGNLPVIGTIIGCFPNFMAAYIINLFPVSPIISKNIPINKARIIVYAISALVFLILAAEEMYPMWGASTTYDLFDILAGAAGSLFAILTFEIIANWRKDKTKTFESE